MNIEQERSKFEEKFPVPDNCQWCGDGYAPTEFNAWEAKSYADKFKGWMARSALQSPEIQALKKDAERYRWLRDSGNDDISVVSGLGCIDSGSSNVVGTYEYILDGEQLDSSIDLACRAEEEGNK